MSFLESFANVDFEERIIQEVHVDKKLFKTGDLLISRRWTGFPTEIMILSGGFASQVSMLKVENGNVFVIEAQPNKINEEETSGVQRHSFEEWMFSSAQAGSEVAWLPLDPQFRNEFFDEHALDVWF